MVDIDLDDLDKIVCKTHVSFFQCQFLDQNGFTVHEGTYDHLDMALSPRFEDGQIIFDNFNYGSRCEEEPFVKSVPSTFKSGPLTVHGKNLVCRKSIMDFLR